MPLSDPGTVRSVRGMDLMSEFVSSLVDRASSLRQFAHLARQTTQSAAFAKS
jgi:hypothetical protein